MSNAARRGLKMSQNVWAWATIAALTAGHVGVNRSGLAIGADDFSDSDDLDSPQSQVDASAFQG